MRLILAAVLLALSACGTAHTAAPPAPTPTPHVRALRPGPPQITLGDPTTAARTWLISSAVTRPGGVVVVGVDDIALSISTGHAIRGTLALARDAVAWGRTVLYLTTNGNPDVRVELGRAGFPSGAVWTPQTAPWCGRHASDEQFRAGCIDYLAHRHDVVLWLTRGDQSRTPADRTYAFAG